MRAHTRKKGAKMPFKSSTTRTYAPITMGTVKVSDFDALNAKFAGDPTSSRKAFRTEIRKVLRSKGVEWSVTNKVYSLFVPNTTAHISSERQEDYTLVGHVTHDGRTGVAKVTLTHEKLVAKGTKK